jgi:hypothetical protein
MSPQPPELTLNRSQILLDQETSIVLEFLMRADLKTMLHQLKTIKSVSCHNLMWKVLILSLWDYQSSCIKLWIKFDTNWFSQELTIWSTILFMNSEISTNSMLIHTDTGFMAELITGTLNRKLHKINECLFLL